MLRLRIRSPYLLQPLTTVSARRVLTLAAYLVATSVWLCIERVEGEVVLAFFALLAFLVCAFLAYVVIVLFVHVFEELVRLA